MISVLLSPAAETCELVADLERIDAKAIKWPQLKIGPPENCSALDDAIENLFGYDWLILKNTNTARFFLGRFGELNHRIDELDNLRVCVIGEDTAALIRESQIHVDVEIVRRDWNRVFNAVKSYVGDSDSMSSLNFLVPSANVIQELFQNQFEEAGARVDNVTGYRTTSDPHALAQLNALLVGGGIDCLFFKNAAEISEFAQLFDTNDLSRILDRITVVCGNQSTKTVAAQFGLARTIAPEAFSTGAIVESISASASTL